MQELQALIEAQGKAFEEFKSAHAQELAEVRKATSDVVTTDKLNRISEKLDDLAEQKAAVEQAITAEVKAREALELKVIDAERRAVDDPAAARNLDAFNLALKSSRTGRGRQHEDLDAEAFGHYAKSFEKFLRFGRDELSADEAKAMSVGVDTDGGYLVTPEMSSRIITRVFETSPMRAAANVVSISSDALEGIEDLDEADAGWVGETASRPDTDTPQLGQWRIPTHEVYAQPKVTQRLLDDAAMDIEAYLARKTGDKIARMENAAYVGGSGVTAPRGFTTYTTAADSGSGVTWGTIGHVVSGANGAFAGSNPADKLYDLVGTLKTEYLANAAWMAPRAVITAIRKFKDGQGQYLWQPSLQAGQPERLMDYPIIRAEDLPALATNSLSLWFADWMEAYTIVDRLGMRTLRDPYTSKPYVRFYTIKRTGGDVVNFEAIKAMKFST